MSPRHSLAARQGRAWGRRTPLSAGVLAAILGTAGALAPAAAGATGYAILHQFDGTHGSQPFGAMALDASGTLYGATVNGGMKDLGVLYRLQGKRFDVLHAFRGGTKDGQNGYGSVAFDAAGRLVGTTAWGGASDAGTVFTWDTAHGYRPFASLPGGMSGRGLQAGVSPSTDGRLYGAALYGGDATCDCGTVFRVDGTTGAITTLHAFTGADGSYPVAPPLPSGNTLSGTTMSGGASDAGTPFTLRTDGTHFMPVPPAGSTQFYSGLVPDRQGVLWGTFRGGDVDNGGIYRIDAGGTYAVAHRFAAASDGYWPTGTLVVGADGQLYGTATQGGKRGAGTVFRYDPATDVMTVLHAFGGTDGAHPQAGLVQDGQGHLFGVTSGGGVNNVGVVFQVTP